MPMDETSELTGDKKGGWRVGVGGDNDKDWIGMNLIVPLLKLLDFLSVRLSDRVFPLSVSV